ncbi:MAG TPA: nucleotide kinase domain-containing protein [Candidatus Saccharimonadales bacterium]|nr:nucleotide kinase domain-containing protein [Candidatus Saccharimonadales bacterium]
MRQPTVRQPIYDLYWYFASERQAVFERRQSNPRGPWTDDPILATYKFCNVFRASDRVSQYLIREVAYGGSDEDVSDILFGVIAFRFFSRPETWEAITEYLGHRPRISDLESVDFERAIEHAQEKNGRLYTGAFILCANNAYGFSKKYQNHLALFRQMFIEDRLGARLLAAKSLKDIYSLLRTYPLIGDFMAYQLAIDLNYTPYLDFDENSFTKAGPGALRGIQKAFQSLGSLSPEQIILQMVEVQDKEFTRLNLQFAGLGGRKLHAIDCQGLFCELDKYCREAVPELASARKRIKARHTPNLAKISYFYPPKWGLAS